MKPIVASSVEHSTLLGTGQSSVSTKSETALGHTVGIFQDCFKELKFCVTDLENVFIACTITNGTFFYWKSVIKNTNGQLFISLREDTTSCCFNTWCMYRLAMPSVHHQLKITTALTEANPNLPIMPWNKTCGKWIVPLCLLACLDRVFSVVWRCSRESKASGVCWSNIDLAHYCILEWLNGLYPG